MASSLRILVAISDVPEEGILAWPALKLLQLSYPDSQIDLITGAGNAELVRLLSGIGEVFESEILNHPEGTKLLRDNGYDVYFCLSPRYRHRWLGRRLGIRQRFVASVRMRRFWDGEAIGRPAEPMQLRQAYEQAVMSFLPSQRCTPMTAEPPYLSIAAAAASAPLNVMVHLAGSDDRESLESEQYLQLMASLQAFAPQLQITWCVRAAELPLARHLSSRLSGLATDCDIEELGHDWAGLASRMAQCHLVIGGQGIVLWLAGAMSVPCVGFGPIHPGVDALYHPLALERRCLMFNPPAGRLTQEDVSLINVTDSAVKIRHWLLQLPR